MASNRSDNIGRGPFRSEFRVCVVSTSADVRAERDALNRDVFPHLRRGLAERGVVLTVSDPRWEVMLAPQHAERLLKEGLESLHGHRPVFVGIFGRGMGGADSYPWLRDIAGDADIALRFMARVAGSRMMRDRALFYILESGESDRDPHGVGAAAGDAVELIIERIRRDGFAVREAVASVEELAALVLADLEAAFERMNAKGIEASAAERDRRAQEQFADAHRRGYVEIRSYLDRLEDHVLHQGRSVAVVGESGAGKSALLVAWVDHIRATRPDIMVIDRFVDAAPGDDDLVSVLRYVMADLKEYYCIDEPVPNDADSLVDAFHSRLAHAPSDRMLLLIVDGVDRIAAGRHGRRWLPRRLPGNVRLVVSGMLIKPPTTPIWTELRIEPLTLAQTRSITDRLVEESGSQPVSEFIHRLATASVRPSPFFLRTIAHHAGRANGAPDVEAFSDIGSVEELMSRILQQGEARFGASPTGRVLSLLRCARKGLTREELAALTAVGESVLAGVLAEFEPYLVDRDGLLSYIHEHVRRAVDRRYIAGDDVAHRLHADLAGFFASGPMDERRVDEEPWHLQRAGEHERLADSITEIPMFMALSAEERRYELLGYCVALGDADAFVRRLDGRFAAWSVAEAFGDFDGASVLERIGRFCTTAGWLTHAERFLRAALCSKQELYGEAHPSVADTLHELAELLRHAGRFAEAEGAYTAALAIREAKADPLDPALAAVLSDLALLYREQRKPDKALPLYLRAVALKERIHGPDHPATAESLNDLALLYHDLGDLEAAVGLNLRALDVRLARFGSNHPVTATSHDNLGSVYRRMGQPDAAEREYRLALAIGEDRLGADHPHTIGTVANLASLLQSRGVLDEARDLFRRAIDTTIQSLGSDHPNAIAFSISYAHVLRDSGDLIGAENTLRETLSRLLGIAEGHPQVPVCAHNLASILRRLGRDVEALPLFAIAAEGWERSVGPDHSDIAGALQNQAAIHFMLGDPATAEPMVRRALTIREQHYGAEHELTRKSAALLADIMRAMGGR